MMSILRNRLKSRYSPQPNALCTDLFLSDAQYRIIAYLYTKPDGWKVNNTDICKRFDIKTRETIANHWKVIIASGWVSRTKVEGSKGKFSGYDYMLNPVPCRVDPYMGSAEHGLNPTHSKTEFKKKQRVRKTEFKKPEKSEVQAYFEEIHLSSLFAQKETIKFMDFYNKNGWQVGKKNKRKLMSNWKLAGRNWVKHIKRTKTVKKTTVKKAEFSQEGCNFG